MYTNTVQSLKNITWILLELQITQSTMHHQQEVCEPALTSNTPALMWIYTQTHTQEVDSGLKQK